jgi:hypothetical protein
VAIRRFSTADLTGRKGSSVIGGYGWGWSEMDSLQTATVGAGGAATVTFSNIPQTYQHLQVRVTAKMSGANQAVWAQFNSDTAANYSMHFLFGNGSSASAGSRLSDAGIDVLFQPTATDKEFAGVIDILDYTNTSKHKVTRTLYGFDSNGAGYVALNSGSWRNTAAITTIRFIDLIGGASFLQHSSLALYGIKG